MGSSSKNKPPAKAQGQQQGQRPQGPLQGAGPQQRPYGLPDIPIGLPINPEDAGTGAAGTIAPQGGVYGGGHMPGAGIDRAMLAQMMAQQQQAQKRSDMMAVGGRGARGMGGAFGNGFGGRVGGNTPGGGYGGGKRGGGLY